MLIVRVMLGPDLEGPRNAVMQRRGIVNVQQMRSIELPTLS
jgi:hypothetical protein